MICAAYGKIYSSSSCAPSIFKQKLSWCTYTDAADSDSMDAGSSDGENSSGEEGESSGDESSEGSDVSGHSDDNTGSSDGSNSSGTVTTLAPKQTLTVKKF